MTKLTAITIPKWGLSMDEGTLVSWAVKEGDRVNPGDALAEIESSKIVNTLESHVAGFVYRRVGQEDETLPVGALLAVVGEPGLADGEIDAFIKAFKPESLSTVSGDSTSAAEKNATGSNPGAASPAAVDPGDVPEHFKQGPDDSAVSASPHARRLARKLGINLNNIQGSGRNNRISVEDIELAINGAAGTPAGAGFVEVPMSATRQTIAKRLQESKNTIPHYRLVAEVRVDTLQSVRQAINSASEIKVTLNDMLLKACSIALQSNPDCNIRLEGNVIKKFTETDIAIAVALPDGLMTPVVRSVNSKSVTQVAKEAAGLVDKARSHKLSSADIEGGTLTVSNLGMFGIRQFDAIINPPQCAILAAGTAEPRVVADNNQAVVATMLTLSLSLDHRVIDGATGARFMQALRDVLENPDKDVFTRVA